MHLVAHDALERGHRHRLRHGKALGDFGSALSVGSVSCCCAPPRKCWLHSTAAALCLAHSDAGQVRPYPPL